MNMQPINKTEKIKARAYDAARHEIGQFDDKAWLALCRLLGGHFPFTETEKIDLLIKVKLGGLANEFKQANESS